MADGGSVCVLTRTTEGICVLPGVLPLRGAEEQRSSSMPVWYQS